MTSSSRILHIHSSEFPDSLRADLLAGLHQRRIPGKWLYHSPAQAELWLAYHQAFSPSRGDRETLEQYDKSFRQIFKDTGASPRQVISLGCGGGRKDGLLFRIMAESGDGLLPESAHYLPLDTSPALALEATLHLDGLFPELRKTSLVADLASQPDLTHWLGGLGVSGEKRLLTCFGMLPNLPLGSFPRWLAGQMGPTDLLLISANLSPVGFPTDRERILPQYDNPYALAWYREALTALGVPGAAFEIAVSAESVEPDGSIWRMAADAIMAREVTFHLYGEKIHCEKGERFRVFHSDRYTHQAVQATLSDAGLETVQDWQASSGEEGIYLCRRLA